MDDGLARFKGERRQVLFEATSPVSVAVFRPVFDRIRTDSRLQFWFTSSDSSWDAAQIFDSVGITEGVLTAHQARWKKFDLYVNTDFWNMTWLPRRARRVHLFHGVAGKYELDAPVRLALTISTFDRLFFPNRDRLTRYAEAGLVDPCSPVAALIGYPKVDCLVDGSLDREQIATALGLDRSRPTVIYAPTWSPYSSLHLMGEAILRILSGLDVNVIVKLHDRSFDAAARASGGIDWRQHLRRITRGGRVHVVDGADVSPYLFVADALITDHSSVGFEYMLLDRPLIVMDCPELAVRARINKQKLALMRSAADVAVTPDELTHLLSRALANPDVRGERRRAIAAALFHDPGRAAARAACAIYDLLLLTQPEALASEVAVADPFRQTKAELLN
jgi:hypothetical protein